jgi:8-oxo-dGTP diphosphatase
MTHHHPLPVPAIGVGAVVFDALNRVLLIRRGRPPAEGRWSLPGGKQEPGETLGECCAREVREETGLEVVPGPVVALAERRIEGFHYVIVDFLAELPAGAALALRAADDVRDARWVALSELDGYDLVEGMREVVLAGLACREAGGNLGLSDAAGSGRLFLPALAR